MCIGWILGVKGFSARKESGLSECKRTMRYVMYLWYDALVTEQLVKIVQRWLFVLKVRNHISISALILLGARLSRATVRRLENRLTGELLLLHSITSALFGLVVASSYVASPLSVPWADSRKTSLDRDGASAGVIAVAGWARTSGFGSGPACMTATGAGVRRRDSVWVAERSFAPLTKKRMQKHIKAKRVKAPEIHPQSTSVNQCQLLLSCHFQFRIHAPPISGRHFNINAHFWTSGVTLTRPLCQQLLNCGL